MKFYHKLFIFAACLFSNLGFANADSQIIGGQWRGLNTGDSSLQIADNEAQDLLNVDVTASGYGIKKRDGTTQFRTLSSSTWGVRGGYYFKDAAGNNNIIHANAKAIYYSRNGAAYVSFITTQTDGAYYDFTDSNGTLWFANSGRDVIASWTGTALTSYASSPQGNQIEALPDRLAITGTTANPNRVHFSKRADFTSFAAGTEDASAFTEDIGLPGASINCAKWADDRLLVWSRTSGSEIFTQSQFDLAPTIEFSNTIGCVQPNSVIRDFGVTYWQGQDGHFYGYDNGQVTWLSKSISETIAQLATGGQSKQWPQRER